MFRGLVIAESGGESERRKIMQPVVNGLFVSNACLDPFVCVDHVVEVLLQVYEPIVFIDQAIRHDRMQWQEAGQFACVHLIIERHDASSEEFPSRLPDMPSALDQLGSFGR
eukprot:3356683-Prymnesium_polylepis.1